MVNRHAIAALAMGLMVLGHSGPALADTGSLTDQSGLEFDFEWGTTTSTYVVTTTYTTMSTYTTTGGGTTTSTYTTSSGTTVTGGSYPVEAEIDEASYTTSVVHTTESGGTSTDTLGDLFDGYLTLSVGAEEFNGQAGTRLLCNDREIDFGSQTMSGIDVSRRAFVPSTDEFARVVTVFTNNGDATVSFTAVFDSDMGSDSDTMVHSSSSGDTLVGTDDTWFVTYGDFSDPRAGHVVQGEEASVVPTVVAINYDNDEDEIRYSYDLELKSGETLVLLHFVTGQPNVADAQAMATALAALTPASALECLSQDEIDAAANFFDTSSGGGGCSCDIPGGDRGSSPWAPAALSLLLVAVFLHRRRSGAGSRL